MNRTEKYKKSTDQAWNKLYRRLDGDGLIPDTESKENPTTGNHHSLFLKESIGAAAAIFLICLSVFYITSSPDQDRSDLLTRKNGEESTLVTTLEDGSVVYLGGQASLQYPKHFSADKREVCLQGNALFDVTGNRKRPFLIETEKVQIEVLGTAFHVKSDESKPFELSVQRGVVKVTLKNNNQELRVPAGKTVTLLSEKLQLSTTRDFEQFDRYTERLSFKDEKLTDILRAINLRGQGIRLQSSPKLGERLLTVSFSGNSPEIIAELICQALNLKYTVENDLITIHE